nr:hypothetical protein [uncultured Rhodopila sp.]
MLRVLFTDSAPRQADEIGAWGDERFARAVQWFPPFANRRPVRVA